MRVVLQRVTRCEVRVAGEIVGSIGRGLALLVGVERGDSIDVARKAADKCVDLRVFGDREGKMNLSVADVSGEVLVVSQFTLAGSTRKGLRPSYGRAAPPADAEPIVDALAQRVRERLGTVATGRFRASMEVDLVNDGPVTLVVDLPPTGARRGDP